MDQLDRVKAIVAEMDVPGRIRLAFPEHDETIPPMVTAVYAEGNHSLIRVFLDATTAAFIGDEKAYEYQGRVIQHRSGDFPLSVHRVAATSGDDLRSQIEALVGVTLGKMRAIGLYEIAEPVA